MVLKMETESLKEKTLIQISKIIGEYLSTGNGTKAKRKLQMIKINTERNQLAGRNRLKAVKNLELASKMF